MVDDFVGGGELGEWDVFEFGSIVEGVEEDVFLDCFEDVVVADEVAFDLGWHETLY